MWRTVCQVISFELQRSLQMKGKHENWLGYKGKAVIDIECRNNYLPIRLLKRSQTLVKQDQNQSNCQIAFDPPSSMVNQTSHSVGSITNYSGNPVNQSNSKQTQVESRLGLVFDWTNRGDAKPKQMRIIFSSEVETALEKKTKKVISPFCVPFRTTEFYLNKSSILYLTLIRTQL